MLENLLVQVLSLCLPRHTTMLGDLPCGLLVDHRTLETIKRCVDLSNHIAVLGQVERHRLNITLGESDSLTVVQSVGPL